MVSRKEVCEIVGSEVNVDCGRKKLMTRLGPILVLVICYAYQIIGL